MIEQSHGPSKLLGGLGYHRVHFREAREEVRLNLGRREPAWGRVLGRCPTLRKIFASENNERPGTILQTRHSGQRSSGCEAAFKTLGCAGVRQVQVFENLGRTPLALRLPGVTFWRKPGGRPGDVILESLKMEIHGAPRSFI